LEVLSHPAVVIREVFVLRLEVLGPHRTPRGSGCEPADVVVGELEGSAGTVVEIVIPRVSLAEIGDIAGRKGAWAVHGFSPVGRRVRDTRGSHCTSPAARRRCRWNITAFGLVHPNLFINSRTVVQ
jgi:hypothetical protein